MRRVMLVLAALAAALLAHAAPGGAIVGGELDNGLHPEVGAVVVTRGDDVGPLCSGVLISPTVFLTAAHCMTRQQYRVTFESPFTKNSKMYEGKFHPHPLFDPDRDRSPYDPSPYDIAVIVFNNEVEGITPARLPAAGLLDSMKKAGELTQATEFTAVGYGFLGYENGPGGQQRLPGQRTRRYAVSSFDALAPSYLHLSQNAATGDGGTCAGDSGGPNYLGAGDNETDVIAGITVSGDVYCKATNVPLRVDIKKVRDLIGNFVELP